MARDLDPAIDALIDEERVLPVLLFVGEFRTGTARFWSGIGDLVWGGNTFTGVGSLGGISPISETADVQAEGLQVSLSAMSSDVVALILAASEHERRGEVYLGLLDNAGQLVGDPYQVFSGLLDVPAMEDAGSESVITISYESRLIDLERPRERRYTHDDQRIEFPTDRGFEYAASLLDKSVTWGTAK
jgi:hypothetical protein